MAKKATDTLGISEEQHAEAYNYLYDEYGYIMTLWDSNRLEREIENYWQDKLDEE